MLIAHCIHQVVCSTHKLLKISEVALITQRHSAKSRDLFRNKERDLLPEGLTQILGATRFYKARFGSLCTTQRQPLFGRWGRQFEKKCGTCLLLASSKPRELPGCALARATTAICYFTIPRTRARTLSVSLTILSSLIHTTGLLV